MATKQIAFIIFFCVASGAFAFTSYRIYRFFKLTNKGFPVDRIGERIKITLLVAFGQTKILRKPLIGFLHALVWWGFLVITVGTAEIVIDGITGTERILRFSGIFYNILTASADVLAAITVFACIIFLARRHVMTVKRFSGVEMTKTSNADATIALLLILFLMVSLTGMNMGYMASNPSGYHGLFPVSELLLSYFPAVPTSEIGILAYFHSWAIVHEINWWSHIVLVFLFLNILPYSKHFHVIMSVPNVFFSRLEPMTKITNMEEITKEVKLIMNPDTAYAAPAEGEQAPPARFGIKDIEDVTRVNYLDSLACTHCGRCTDVCPANITGKLLSPRKILVDTRHRMKDKGPGLIKDPQYDDGKSLVGDYITAEELWACTTCNACVQECPLNIDHVSLIVDMRRYLVMEESSAPESLNKMFTNIENNGAPWPYAQTERMNWAEGIEMRINN